jgi:2-octaprenyl-6-methoxyphenol hydroxylase
MSRSVPPQDRVCDVLIAGAGLAGLTAAIAFAREGFDVVACGADERLAAGRTVAMLDPTVAYLDRLQLWEGVEPMAAPMRALRILDDTGGLFPPQPVEFRSSEIGLETFGWNVENDRMADALAAKAARTPRLERIAARIGDYDFSGERATARIPDGRKVQAALVVAADGRDSPARKAAGLIVRRHAYPQSALTALLVHRLPHDGFSTEFHTRAGPFTLVPLPPSDAGANRSSLVWLMGEAEARRRAGLPDAELAGEIERQARSFLGAMRL